MHITPLRILYILHTCANSAGVEWSKVFTMCVVEFRRTHLYVIRDRSRDSAGTAHSHLPCVLHAYTSIYILISQCLQSV